MGRDSKNDEFSAGSAIPRMEGSESILMDVFITLTILCGFVNEGGSMIRSQSNWGGMMILSPPAITSRSSCKNLEAISSGKFSRMLMGEQKVGLTT